MRMSKRQTIQALKNWRMDLDYFYEEDLSNVKDDLKKESKETLDSAISYLEQPKKERAKEILDDIVDFSGKLAVALFLFLTSGAMILGFIKLLLWVFSDYIR